ncbi:c-type cytochrome [Brevundimonas variabilis]|uniref:c-type cytochrome n=1 Tax=Brevundimonas variabilis TaxID=74312 RepID=UPI001606567C|nr:cytochrome c [Brevundimonas variabilis]
MATQSSTTRAATVLTFLLLAACGTAEPTNVAALATTTPPSLSAAFEIEAASRGRAIAVVGCASCHAIDPTGASALTAAPPFRDIVRRRSLNDLEAAFAAGLVTTHPAMPPYVFRASEIDDLIAYLGTLKSVPVSKG